MNLQVVIERCVLTDLFALPLSRASKLKFLTDLRISLPAHYSLLRNARCEINPSCFWYNRLAVEVLTLHMVRFAVDDSAADVLHVVWMERITG